MDYKKIGKNIQNARKAKNLTQERLAEMINTSTGYISNVETAFKKISLTKLIDIANALNTNVDILLAHEYKNYEANNKALDKQLQFILEELNVQQKKEFFILAKQNVQAIKEIYALNDRK